MAKKPEAKETSADKVMPLEEKSKEPIIPSAVMKLSQQIEVGSVHQWVTCTDTPRHAEVVSTCDNACTYVRVYPRGTHAFKRFTLVSSSFVSSSFVSSSFVSSSLQDSKKVLKEFFVS